MTINDLLMGLALPDCQWGMGRESFSKTRAETENRGWLDINTFY
jgi:hypothetical protein